MKETIKKVKEKKKVVTTIYIILRILVVLCMIRQFFQGNYSSFFLCILTLILFTLPSFFERKFQIELPSTLEIVILLFIFSAEILGEINEFYIHFRSWDTMLHTINGFLMAAIGFSLIDILNKSDLFYFKMSPVFVALVSFCFSMTVGVVWEFFEYGCDKYLRLDMQKDTVITEIISIKFDPDSGNAAIKKPITSLVVNGEDWVQKYGGYIDVGLHDTMKDLFVNFVGAIVFSVIGMFYLRGESNTAMQFVPRRKRE